MSVNVEAKFIMAKVLARENITVVHSGTRTATFDMKRRILTLPIWLDMPEEVYDSFIVHEILHAILTPTGNAFINAINYIDIENPKVARQYINVVEDYRINKLGRGIYAGVAQIQMKGYSTLWKMNFYGTQDKDVNEYSFVDRINIYFKVGPDLSGITFSSEEQPYIEKLRTILTWDEAVLFAKELYDLSKHDNQECTSSSDEDESVECSDDKDDIDDVDPDNQSSIDCPTSQKDNIAGKADTAETVESEENESNKFIDQEGKEYLYLGIPTPKLDKIIVPHNIVHKRIRDFYEDIKTNIAAHELELANLKTSIKHTVDFLFMEFQRYQSADNYSRVQINKVGEIDMDMLHMYKLSEDIMRSMTTIPEGKNHAMEIFVDFSTSMRSSYIGVMHQCIAICMFLRKAKIPFNVYNYGMKATNFTENGTKANNIAFDHQPFDFAFTYGFQLRTIFSSSMTSVQFHNACVNILMLCSGMESSILKGFGQRTFSDCPVTDQMYATPLNEVIITASEIVKKIKKTGKIQIVNVVILTDGEATTHGNFVTSEGNIEQYTSDKYGKVFVVDPISKLKFEISTNEIINTASFLEFYKARTNSNVMGFYVLSENANDKFFKDVCPSKTILENEKELEKKGYLTADAISGYTTYFILPCGKKMRITGAADDISGKKDKIYRYTDPANDRKKFMMLTNFIKMIS